MPCMFYHNKKENYCCPKKYGLLKARFPPGYQNISRGSPSECQLRFITVLPLSTLCRPLRAWDFDVTGVGVPRPHPSPWRTAPDKTLHIIPCMAARINWARLSQAGQPGSPSCTFYQGTKKCPSSQDLGSTVSTRVPKMRAATGRGDAAACL